MTQIVGDDAHIVPPLTPTIRRANPRHLDEITRIEQENFPSPCWSRTLIEAKIHDPQVRFLVCAGDDGNRPAILGYAVLQRIPPEAELLNIAVDRPAQRQGIARALLIHLMEAARAEGITTIHLEARAGNTPALALYHSLGFEVTGRRRGYYQNPVEDAVLMAICDLGAEKL
ncbi:MAG: ribosomal protein S18-alanine N-acetyltransferase [Oscillospiraceae bacterium]|nr:ribosomal protein S18-alanine N-acetyltransferase [Oscillospiraceae bacterium]